MPETGELRECPRCGARLEPTQAGCPECEIHVLAVTDVTNVRFTRRIGLGTVMILVAVAALVFGAFRLAPVLGMLCGAVASVAVLRTLHLMARAHAMGESYTPGRMVGIAVTSTVVGTVLVVTGVIAFVMICVPLGIVSAGAGLAGPLISACVGLVAAALLANSLRKAYWFPQTWELPDRTLDAPEPADGGR